MSKPQRQGTELKRTIEVGIVITIGWIIPGVLLVLAADRFIRWLL